MNFEKVHQSEQIDAGKNQGETQHFTEAELDRYIEGKIEQLLTAKRQAPTRSSSSTSLISESALSNVPFEEELEASSMEEDPIRHAPSIRKIRESRKWNGRGGTGKKPKKEGSSPEVPSSTLEQHYFRSPPTQSRSPSNWPPEVAWLTQRYQSPATRRTNALSMFEENEIFRKEVGQWIRKSMKGWNGSFTDDVLDTRLRDTLIAGATEMRKDAGIPSHIEFQAIEREVTADVLRSLGNMPEDQEKKEQLGQAIALMIDAATRTDSSRYIDESSEALYARSLGLPEPFIPQVQRQLQGDTQLAKLAFSNQRSLPQVRNTPHLSSSLFGRGGRSSTPGKESGSWRRLDTRPQQGQPLKQFTPRREGGSGQEGKRGQQ
ncbi:hypothetical protein BLNAU_22619 [Blattamonas nauphoetae]|uniref:Uncharacterized protein n=1 Tax=Blattamonas nauphoetae TaxID=2049346 RepID=A0ABQ9WSK2_9EUKA|nr:hypothetical protein BLNAU_22619 [Blattamonas nauphoetae]